MKKYEILGGNLPVVVCELAAGESMITESGSMSWMSPNMKMETVSGGGMKKMFGRMMSGDSAHVNTHLYIHAYSPVHHKHLPQIQPVPQLESVLQSDHPDTLYHHNVHDAICRSDTRS